MSTPADQKRLQCLREALAEAEAHLKDLERTCLDQPTRDLAETALCGFLHMAGNERMKLTHRLKMKVLVDVLKDCMGQPVALVEHDAPAPLGDFAGLDAAIAATEAASK
jgi:protein required for attachment to host cells